MQAGAVPVATYGLRIGVRDNVVLLGNQVEQKAGHNQVVRRTFRPLPKALKLPLAQHHLRIDAADTNACGNAGCKMLIDQLSSFDVVGSHGTIIGALGFRIAAFGKSQRPSVRRHEYVLLLETEPELLTLHIVDQRAVVRLVAFAVSGKYLAQYIETILPQRVLVHPDGLENAVRVMAFSLVRRAAVKTPNRQVVRVTVE